MGKNDIIRFNIYCNNIKNEEIINYWNNDRKEYNYKNFPFSSKSYEISKLYKYIENNTPEVIFLLIKNTKNYLYYHIRKKFELNIQNSNNIDDDIKDFIYYRDDITYNITYFFQIIDYRTGLPSKSFIRTTLVVELLPSCWINSCVIELIRYDNNTITLYNSINRKNKIYDSDSGSSFKINKTLKLKR
jgi:hypothetical protein